MACCKIWITLFPEKCGIKCNNLVLWNKGVNLSLEFS